MTTTSETTIIKSRLSISRRVVYPITIEPVNPFKYVASFTAVVIGIFGYDFYMNIESKKEKEREEAKKVIENSVTDESKMSRRQLLLKSYM